MPQNNDPHRGMQYWLGLGLGFIPLILYLIFLGLVMRNGLDNFFLTLFIFTLITYGLELIVVLFSLFDKQRRLMGYGFLTAFLVTPVVAVAVLYATLNVSG